MTDIRCSVAWCDGTGHHANGDGTVDHSRIIGNLDHLGAGELRVAVEIAVTTGPDGTQHRPTVDVGWEYREGESVCLTDGLCFSPAEATALAPLLAEAARLLAGDQREAAA